MRFKKLRLSVGIALILFILIIGSIIVFGKLVNKKPIVQSNNHNQNMLLVDTKQIEPKEIPNETKPIQPVVEVQNSSPPESVVVHHRIRTRAS